MPQLPLRLLAAVPLSLLLWAQTEARQTAPVPALTEGQTRGQTPGADVPEDIRLTADGDAEEWRLSVFALPAQGEHPASHAFLFLGVLPHCQTPRAFTITFTVPGTDPMQKQGALLSRQQAGAGCVDGLATVFPKGTTTALEGATVVTVKLPGRELQLGDAHLAFMRRALATEAEPTTDTSGTTANLTEPTRPLPTDPAARAAAEEATTLNERALELYGAGRLKDAVRTARAAVAAGEKGYGPDDRALGTYLLNLGLLERKAGDNRAAIGHYRRAVALLEKGEPSQSLGIVLDNLGHALEDEKDHPAAMASTTRAVEVLTRVLGPTHEHVGYAINNLAMRYAAKGDHAAAADACDRALTILVAALGADNPRLKPFLEDQRQLRKRAKR